MNRPKRILVAVFLQVLAAIFTLVSATRILAAGQAGLPAPAGAEALGGPPFWAGLMFFTLGIASLFGAFGLWRDQRWGKVVTLVTCVISLVFALGDVLGAVAFGEPAIAAGFGLAVLGYVAIIVLVLWRQPRAATA